MAYFVETAKALANCRANIQKGFGHHLSPEVHEGGGGLPIGEVRYRPGGHSVADIKHTAIGSLAIDRDLFYVPLNIPERPMRMNVIVNESDGATTRMEWLKPMDLFRQRLVSGIVKALHSAKQPQDLVSVYVLGKSVDPKAYGMYAALREDLDPKTAAKEAAKICSNGLNFIISNFEQFPLNDVDQQFKNTVGIKVNYPLELQYVENTGTFATGGLNDVSTDTKIGFVPIPMRKRLFDANNENLRQRHQGIVKSLGEAGLSVVEIVYDTSSPTGMDAFAADKAIARAVNELHATA